MAFFNNRRKDFSIQSPKRSTASGILSVTDSANIDFAFALNNLTADLTQLLPTSGTYGGPTLIPILQIDKWGRVTGVTTTTFSASGILLQTNDVDNISQVILNLKSGTDITVTDNGDGSVSFDYIGTSGNTYTVDNGLSAKTGSPNTFQLGGETVLDSPLIRNTWINVGLYSFNINAVDFSGAIDYGTRYSQDIGNFSLTGFKNNLTKVSTFGINYDVASIVQYDDNPATLGRRLLINRIDGISIEEYVTSISGYKGLVVKKYGLGQIQLNAYGQTPKTFTGTAAWFLAVNSTGDVIEVDAPSGTGTVTNVAATVPNPASPAFSVNVPNPTTSPSIDITANGTTAQYVRGDGSLETTVTKTSELFNDGDNGTSHFISLEDLPSNLTLYATNVASGISTYTKAVSSLTDPDYNTTAVDIPIGPLTSISVPTYCGGVISSANIIIGNPGIFTMSTIGNIRRTGGTAEGIFYYEIYKRDSGGTETFIVASANTIPVSASAYTEFNAAALFNNGVFTATDRVVIKFYGKRLSGGSDPSFDFQFGGTAPVRTTLPIPLVVTPANGVTNVATGTGLAGGPITNTGTISLNTKLAPADSLAGNSLKYLRVNSGETAVEYATVTSSGDSIKSMITDVVATASSPSQTNVTATLATPLKTGSFGVTVDGVTAVVQVGKVGYVTIPYGGTITGWTITANTAGNIQFDIWSAVGAIPTTSIIGANYPTLSGTDFAVFSTLAGWTPGFVAGTVFGFHVIGTPTLIKNVTLTLRCTKLPT